MTSESGLRAFSDRWCRQASGMAAAALLALCGPAQAEQKLTLGAVVPKSWPSPAQGEEIVLGMQLAIKSWPGKAAPTLVIKDGACDAKRSEAAARELVAAKVQLVLGSWCVIGQVPNVVAQAGIPYVSAHAERLTKPPAGVLQLGRVDLYAAEGIADKLRQQTGLRVSARISCWMNFEPVMWPQYDALLCPTLSVDKGRWQLVEATYSAAYGKPFTQSAARGYAAMEAALTQMRRLRSGARVGEEPIDTILGPLLAADAPSPPDAMQLVFAPKLPRLAAREQAVLDQLVKSKGCGCANNPACAKGGPWADAPFEVRGSTAQCPVIASAGKR